MTTKVLQFIGKGQITIPQEWRELLGLKSKNVKATLHGNKIIIEKTSRHEEKSWKIDHIILNTISPDDQKTIREGRKNYKKGKTDKFMTASDFFEK